jgi:hypothetical protein
MISLILISLSGIIVLLALTGLNKLHLFFTNECVVWK